MFKKNNPGCNVNASGCGCASAAMNYTETVAGCNGLAWQGAGLTLRDGSGAVVASGTTDATGKFAAAVAAGTYTLSVNPNNARFATPADQALTVAAAGATTHTTNLAAAAGYHCISGCVAPVKGVLNYTDSAYSVSGTLRFGQVNQTGQQISSTSWTIYSGTVNYDEYVNYPGSGPWPPNPTFPIWIELDGATALRVYHNGFLSGVAQSHSCPPAAVAFVFTVPYNATLPIYPSGTTITITE